MNERDEIESRLRGFDHAPGEAVKRSVLGEFRRRRRDGGRPRDPAPLWRRPVPLYAVAALLVLATGLTLAAGKSGVFPRGPGAASRHVAADSTRVPAWSTVVCDQL